jgi:hypothetical protein
MEALIVFAIRSAALVGALSAELEVRKDATNALRKVAPELLEGIEQRQVQEGIGKSETKPSPRSCVAGRGSFISRR